MKTNWPTLEIRNPAGLGALIIFAIMLLLLNSRGFSQSMEYENQKREKLANASPFEAIIAEDKQHQILYQNDYLVAFEPLRKQVPVHLLIVPKKRVPTLNDIAQDDEEMLGQLLLAAKKLALDYKIDKTGYRISINTNEHAGQSVFHLHVHLMGGAPLGAMVRQD